MHAFSTTPEMVSLESDLKAEGFTPLTAQQWKEYDYYWNARAAVKNRIDYYTLVDYEGIWGRVHKQASANRNGTPEGIAKYIATLYCIMASSPKGMPEQDSINFRWMEQQKLIGWITMGEYKYNRDISDTAIKQQSLARTRLAARLLKRLSAGCDPDRNYYSGQLPSIGELEIGFGFRTHGPVHKMDIDRVPGNLKGNPELSEQYFRTGKVTSEMLTPAQLEREKKRIEKAKSANAEFYLNAQKNKILSAEGDFLRVLQQMTGQPQEITEALALAGFNTPEKQKAFFKRQKSSASWNEAAMPKLLKNLGFLNDI